MTVEEIDTTEALNKVRSLLEEDKNISDELKAAIEVLIFRITMLVNRLSLHSRKSSRPPSSDFGSNSPEHNNNGNDDNDEQDNEKEKENKRKPGGQTGHQGSTREPVAAPNEVIQYQLTGVAFQEEKTTKMEGERFDRFFQYASNDTSLNIKQRSSSTDKVTAMWLPFLMRSLLPHNRDPNGKDTPSTRLNVNFVLMIVWPPISRNACQYQSGSIDNFNLRAYDMLELIEQRSKQGLIGGDLIHAEETGIKLNGNKIW